VSYNIEYDDDYEKDWETAFLSRWLCDERMQSAMMMRNTTMLVWVLLQMVLDGIKTRLLVLPGMVMESTLETEFLWLWEDGCRS
jgi:hypothetical protein